MIASETAVNHDQRQRGSERKTRVRVTKAVGVSVDGGGRGGVACMAGRGTADIDDANGGGATAWEDEGDTFDTASESGESGGSGIVDRVKSYVAGGASGDSSGGGDGREIDAVTPANLCQQVHGRTLRYKRLHWEHHLSSDTMCHPCPL